MSDQGQWVRVESEDELQKGMVIKKVPCGWCGKIEVTVIKRLRPAWTYVACSDGRTIPCEATKGFVVSPNCTPEVTLDGAIREGRLFRLAVPPDEAALADEKEASRRATKVKERTR